MGPANTRAVGSGVVALVMMLAANPIPVHAGAPPGTSCSVFPADNVWNTDISALPVNSHSAAWLSSTGATTGRLLHPDFGGPPYGIPYNVVSSTHATANFNFLYWNESDPTVATQQPQGPYPYGPDLQVEAPTDSHLLTINKDTCTLYEIGGTDYNGPHTGWAGAIFDLSSNALRPDTWTSADAAGLPIFPGLVRLDEVQAGSITHAIRFTVQQSDTSHLWPARHDAGTASDPNLPPMGARFRLKKTFNISGFNAQAQVVLTAMQHYGLIVADNGSNWYFQGTEDVGWNNEPYATMVSQLKTIPASAFEAVDESSLMVDPNSGQAVYHPPCTSVNTTSSPPSTAAVGATVTITATASGCPSPNPTYEFWMLAPGSSTWQVAQPYSTSNILTWHTAGKPAGTYQFSVWARDASSPGTASDALGSWDVYTALSYSLSSTQCATVTSSSAPPNTAATGTPVTITGNATVCPNPRYQFWMLRPGASTWTQAQPYSSNASFAWATLGAPAGTYHFSVWARDASSTGAAHNSLGSWDAYTSVQYTLTTTSCASVTASSSPPGSATAGTPVTISGSAAGCPSPQYEFWILYPGSSAWESARGYLAIAGLSWATNGKPKGLYHFSVWAKDAASAGTYGNSLGRWDAYTSITYMLT